MDFDDSRQGSAKALVVAGLVLLAMALGYSVGLQGATSTRDWRLESLPAAPGTQESGEPVHFDLTQAGQT
jgi:hypothetical protein